MKKTCVTSLLFFLCACLFAGAQQPTFESLSDKGGAQWTAKDYANAAKTFELALQIAQGSHDLDKQLRMRQWLDSAYELLGDTPKALRFAEGTLAFVRQNAGHFRDQDEEEYLLRFLGSLYARQGNYALGVKDLRASLALCQAPKADCGADTGRILRDLGIALYLSGDAKGAEQVLRQAVQSSHAFSSQTAANPSAAATSDFELEALRWLERVLVAQHRTDEALDIAQRCRAGALSLTLTNRLGGRFSESAAAPNANQMRSIAREENATLVEYSVTYHSDPVIPLEFSDFEMLPAAAIYIWVIHPGGAIDFRQASIGAAGLPLAAMVKQVRDAVTARPATNSAARTKLLQQGYQLLVAPIERLLPADPQARVLFVPQDTLYLLPFAALEDSAGKYLIEKHTIATEVSAEVLQLSRQKFQHVPARATAVLVVGNPAMPHGYPPLPGAEKEADSVAGLFSSTALTGAQATKAAVIQRAGDSRVLHFATHGLLNGKDEQFSALVLAPDRSDPGFLAAREIRALKLNAELAVLSACDTGEGRLTGDGVLGLGSSFVEAGVPTLVVSLWSIPDAPTATLMVEFYKNVRLGLDKAQALRSAMLTTMKQFPEPRAWAAFTLLGVPDASAVLRSVHGAPVSVAAASYAPVFPVPDGAQNYHQGNDRNFDFMTSMSLTQAIAFYRQAFRAKGYREDSTRASIEKQTFMLIFHGPWKNQELVVNGTDMGEVRSISVGLYAAH